VVLGACVTSRVGLGGPTEPDGGFPDLGPPDAGHDGGVDLGGPTEPDGGFPDLGPPDAGHDAGVDLGGRDLGHDDLGAPEGGVPDAGLVDGGAPDGGPTDGGALDGGPTDGGPRDLGIPDGGGGVTVVQVAAGSDFSCARLSDGRVFCWGANDSGQLGDGTTMERRTPVAVAGLVDARDIAAGEFHACAVRGDAGEVVCWGKNQHGQVTVGTRDQTMPAPAGGGLMDARRVTAGRSHSCALTSTGRVLCWGRNHRGQLASGDRMNSATAKDVGLSDARSVAAGAEHTCAIASDGAVQCAGANGDQQLGDGTTTDRNTLVSVMMLTRAMTLSARGGTNCALVAEGGSNVIACWGDNAGGQLGDGTTTDRSMPSRVSRLDTPVQVAVGTLHACARLTSGRVRCWGSGGGGRLGNRSTSDSRSPVEVAGLTSVTDIAAGAAHTCAVAEGAAWCWGTGADGRLGDGATVDRASPVRVTGLPL
jgi:alpha-tubulin suppressor-like RCC1 family protein